MRLNFLLSLITLIATGCTTTANLPSHPSDKLLTAKEQIKLRIPAQLMHGHDMQEPPYDAPEGYRPIPTFQGELLLTDQRLLFVEQSAEQTPSWLSIPFAAIARASPSRTALLNYVVVWDSEGHPDSFVVNSSDVQALHQFVGRALMTRSPTIPVPTKHTLPPN